MRKFTKIMLILAGALATIGVICVAASFAMGLNFNTIVQMVGNGDFSFEKSDSKPFNYEVKESFKDLDIEFGAGVLEVRYDDVETVQVQGNGIKNLKVDVKENTLVIKETKNVHISFGSNENRSLVVIIPNGMQFQEVDIEIGASKAQIADVLADEISITVGAGDADISNLTVKQFDLEVGAGKATVVQLTADNIDVEAGLGKVTMDVNGVQQDYNCIVECGVGSVVIGDNSYNGLGAEQNISYDSATKRIHVECGVGEVRVNFQD